MLVIQSRSIQLYDKSTIETSSWALMFSSCKGWSQEDAISCSDVAGEQEKRGSWDMPLGTSVLCWLQYIIWTSE